MLKHFKNGLDQLSEDKIKFSPYKDIYTTVVHFENMTPLTYRQGIGEMIFHQLRLMNMCHLGEHDPFLFRDLDLILQLIPDNTFLGKKKLDMVGEGRIREVLKSKDGCLELKEARDAIKRYGLKNSHLTKTIDNMDLLEQEHKRRMRCLKKAIEKQEDSYTCSREKILSEIGEEMHDYDYRY